MQKKGLLADLTKSFCCLPGVGPKTAQRMSFHILQRDRASGKTLADTLLAALEKIGECGQCRTLTEETICAICADPRRNTALLCIVENPADAWIIEQASLFDGHYFVLNGRLSPLDGIGPTELGMNQLEARLAEGLVKELILATNSTVEGEATAFFIAELAKKYGVQASRIAHGVPMGGELEFIDSGTLTHAFNGRKSL
jgi:recombination protein RecR